MSTHCAECCGRCWGGDGGTNEYLEYKWASSKILYEQKCLWKQREEPDYGTNKQEKLHRGGEISPGF